MIKYVFIDMDNTIAENTTCDNVDYYEGLYLNKRPIKIVINAIKYLYPNSKYIILSKMNKQGQGRHEKLIWLRENFYKFEHVLLIDNNEKKSDYIKSFMFEYDINPKDVLLIDDKKEILQDCKTLGINVKYPQQIICDYEEMLD